MSSSNIGNTRDWTSFLTEVNANPFFTAESQDFTLQPGEEYPTAPHPHMVLAHKLKEATLNQVIVLVTTSPKNVPSEARAAFSAQRITTRKLWVYQFTPENPCAPNFFEH